MTLAALHARRREVARDSLVSRETSARFTNDDLAEGELLSLAGGNYIDDGLLLEDEGPEGVDRVKAALSEMDGHAAAIRKGLNGLVRKALEVHEDATRMDMEGDFVQGLKPAASQLLAAYTKLVSLLQQAREGVGYEPGEGSVTSLETESLVGEVERIIRNVQTEDKPQVELSWDKKTRTIRMTATPSEDVTEETFWKVVQTVRQSMKGHAGYAAAATVGKKVVGEVQLNKSLEGDDLKKATKALGLLVKTELHKWGLDCG